MCRRRGIAAPYDSILAVTGGGQTMRIFYAPSSRIRRRLRILLRYLFVTRCCHDGGDKIMYNSAHRALTTSCASNMARSVSLASAISSGGIGGVGIEAADGRRCDGVSYIYAALYMRAISIISKNEGIKQATSLPLIMSGAMAARQ
ncbi:hypothetical protein AVEN_253882-1 [Araneus ventricosus]|uniref:Uncharacterized protein n=1 Tax=Araneus ventricosus TaxID=182803 RepID=A0A4Y2W986_ARAVE|nr:hypothetical protein AVEN_253882-1 [Araneus ventricosus]